MNVIRFAASLVLVMTVTAHAQVLFAEDFNDNSAGWTFEGYHWQIGPAVTGGCGTDSDPGSDADGKPGGGLAGFEIGGCVQLPPGAGSQQSFLVSPPIDASGATQLRLEFDHWRGSGGQGAFVHVFNGSAWLNVGGYFQTSGWTHVSIDISAHANPALQVRFRFLYASTPTVGWSVDNVRISNREFFHDRFNDNAAGWTLGPQWAIGPATASLGCATDIGYFDDPSSDADGTPAGGVAGVFIGGCVGAMAHARYSVTSPPVDTSGASMLRLSFDRWLNSDFLGYMDSVVEVYDGTAWVGVFGTCCVLIADSSWVHVTYDVTAQRNAAFMVRIGYDHNGAAYDVSGWNVDNVSLYDPSGCSLAVWSYNGPGSVRVRAHCLTPTTPPGTLLFNCFTLAAGAYPNGWFFGLDPSFNDIFTQLGVGAPPFVGTSDSDGNLSWQLPASVPPGLTVYGVSVALSPGLNVLAHSPPVFFLTQ